MKHPVNKLLDKHQELIQSDNQKVVSHVQRESGDWYVNTLMLDGHNVPFRYKRKERYRSLEGQRVNLTYYRDSEAVAGIDMEIMTVVRVKRS